MTLESSRPYELEIKPDPTPEERAVIEATLAIWAGDQDGPIAWWRAGLLEGLEEEER